MTVVKIKKRVGTIVPLFFLFWGLGDFYWGYCGFTRD